MAAPRRSRQRSPDWPRSSLCLCSALNFVSFPAQIWLPAKQEADGAQFWKSGSKAAFPSSLIAAIWEIQPIWGV